MPLESAANRPSHSADHDPASRRPLTGLALSHDQYFAASLEAALRDNGAPLPALTRCATADEAKRALSAQPFQFALVDSRADPERAMATLANIRSAAPALTLLLTGAPESRGDANMARQAFAMGASDILHGPAWEADILRHALYRAAYQTDAASTAYAAQHGRATDPPAAWPNQADRSLMAEVGHEMRSPLGTIIGFAQSIEQEAVGPIAAAPDQYRDYARNIRTSGEHLLALFEDLLEIGSATAKSIAAAETVTPAVLLERAAAMVQGGLIAKNLTLDVHAEASAPTVFGNTRLIQQAILNLLQNAIKFTPPDGTIRLECSGETELCVTVRDDGIGMEQGTLNQLRAHAPLLEAASQRGYGLGLPFVARVAAAHAGRFLLESKLGEGTVASIIVPINRQRR